MLTSMNYVDQSKKHLEKLIKTYDKYKEGKTQIDLETIRQTLLKEMFNLDNALQETKYIRNSSFNITRNIFDDLWHEIRRSMTSKAKKPFDMEDFVKPLNDLLDNLNAYQLDGFIKYHYDNRFTNNWMSMGVATVQRMDMRKTIEAIQTPNDREITFFDMNAYRGDTLTSVKSINSKINTYALCRSSTSPIGRELRKSFTRYIIGGMKGSTISNNAFDVVFCAPPLQVSTSLIMPSRREEREYLTKAFNYVRPGGILIYTIPFFRFYADICDTLSRHLDNVQVYSSEYSLSACAGMVYVIGQKRNDVLQHPDNHTYGVLRNIKITSKKNQDDDLAPYMLPADPIEVKYFRSGILEDEELMNMYDASSATAQFFKNQNVEKIGDNTKHPLLPFNVGQLGLVLTSGCLDGVVDEGDGCSHVVKGRVVKRTESNDIFNGDASSVEVTELTTNRVEIRAFRPDGEYVKLA